MTSDTDPGGDSDDRLSLLPTCPTCGDPVSFLTVTGPHTGIVNPCGCSMPPGLLERDD
ncbi:hypothetical protein [Natrinema salinisoli]|uniref:hypothetical protein n=1 Tax=Natrinema salinisoli TaxID=2878535 RepID=UPI001CF05FF4|nr:hypothetical protein [Natrinema salinisoli]